MEGELEGARFARAEIHLFLLNWSIMLTFCSVDGIKLLALVNVNISDGIVITTQYMPQRTCLEEPDMLGRGATTVGWPC